MFRRSRRATLLTLIACCVGVAGSWAYYQHRRYKHVAIHEPGMVYRSAWLEPGAFDSLIEKYQIRAVVNLCKPGEMGEPRWQSERHAVSNAGAVLVELEMPTTVEAADPAIAKHLQVMSNPDNYPMLVHCQHGVTRTSKFLAMYDVVYRGMTGDSSLGAQPLFGREDHNVNVRAFVKSFEKSHRWLYPTATSDDLRILRQ